MYCRFNLTPKFGPVYLIQSYLQNSRKVIFKYIDHPKIKFYTIFTYTNYSRRGMYNQNFQKSAGTKI